MIPAILICSLYIAVLLILTKFFGIKYTDIIKNNKSIKRGIIYPVGIGTILLVVTTIYLGLMPSIFSFEPKNSELLLWAIPFFMVVGIVFRLKFINRADFEKNGLLLLGLATLLVGFSEELLVRGLAVHYLLEDGFSLLLTGIISSVIFGLLHFMNYFNGQDFKKTSLQVVTTILMGFNFFVILIITGSLLIPIILHFLYDFSILCMGKKQQLSEKSLPALVITISFLAMFILPIVALFFI